MKTKPTRRDLLLVIGQLQDLIGEANGIAGNDRNPNRLAETKGTLDMAFGLAVEAQGFDKPVAGGSKNGWNDAPVPKKEFV